jgi:hypothetical protein
VVGSMEDIGYLIGALGDGGLYYLRYKGKRSEYRVSWTQGSLEYLEKSIIPRLRRTSNLVAPRKIWIFELIEVSHSTIAKQVLAELGIGSKGPYLDDKRRGVYVIEVPRAYASQFYSIIKPEHPKLGVDTGPHPRKFRRA